MKIEIEDIRRKFEILCDETLPREDIANFASQALQAYNYQTLEMDPVFADKIIEGLIYLSGVDLRTAPDEYLHINEDFVEKRKNLGM